MGFFCYKKKKLRPCEPVPCLIAARNLVKRARHCRHLENGMTGALVPTNETREVNENLRMHLNIADSYLS
jgi:hypothetical protein